MYGVETLVRGLVQAETCNGVMLNLLVGSLPSSVGNWISNGNSNRCTKSFIDLFQLKAMLEYVDCL